MISDAVTIWGRQLLMLSAVNTFRDLGPVLLMIIGDFAGTLKAHQAAMERGSTESGGKKTQVAGSVSDLLTAQANAADPNGDSCFYAERPSMQGAHYGGAIAT
jgi:hypothetical protein